MHRLNKIHTFFKLLWKISLFTITKIKGLFALIIIIHTFILPILSQHATPLIQGPVLQPLNQSGTIPLQHLDVRILT